MSFGKGTSSQIWANFTKVIGPSKPLPTADLPTLRDVLQQALLLKESRETGQSSDDVFGEVASLVVAKWRLASVRLVEENLRIADFAIKEKIRWNWGLITTYKGGKKKGRVLVLKMN